VAKLASCNAFLLTIKAVDCCIKKHSGCYGAGVETFACFVAEVAAYTDIVAGLSYPKY